MEMSGSASFRSVKKIIVGGLHFGGVAGESVGAGEASASADGCPGRASSFGWPKTELKDLLEFQESSCSVGNHSLIDVVGAE
jgi:hypothetical protein